MELAKLRRERVELKQGGGDEVSDAGNGVSGTVVGTSQAKDGLCGAGDGVSGA